MNKILFLTILLIIPSSYALTQKELLQAYKGDAFAEIDASKQRQADIEQLQIALNKLILTELQTQRDVITRFNLLMAEQIDKNPKKKHSKAGDKKAESEAKK